LTRRRVIFPAEARQSVLAFRVIRYNAPARPILAVEDSTCARSPADPCVDGKQYVAVTTGNGGGSPRNVPATIAPEIHSPATGNALYVFALPE